MHRSRLFKFCFVISVMMVTGRASGGTIYMATDRFGYTGSLTQYATLGDAQSGMNPLSTTSVGQRDLSISFTDNNPDTGNNFYTTLTA